MLWLISNCKTKKRNELIQNNKTNKKLNEHRDFKAIMLF